MYFVPSNTNTNTKEIHPPIVMYFDPSITNTKCERKPLTYYNVFCSINCIPKVPKLAKRHDEHLEIKI